MCSLVVIFSFQDSEWGCVALHWWQSQAQLSDLARVPRLRLCAGLAKPVDVYAKWIDECEKEEEKSSEESEEEDDDYLAQGKGAKRQKVDDNDDDDDDDDDGDAVAMAKKGGGGAAADEDDEDADLSD